MSLEISSFEAGFNDCPIVTDVNMHLPKGAIGLLRGSNGAGKSTLIKGLANCAGVWSRGDIIWNGNKVGTSNFNRAFLNRDLYYVPQDCGVFDELSVVENLQVARIGRCKLSEALPDSLQHFYEQNANVRAGLLSGGQRKVLAILMGLMCKSPLLFMDEPFAGLSEQGKMGDLVVAAILDAHFEGRTMLVAEHRSGFLLRLLKRTKLIHAFTLENGRVVEMDLLN